MTFQNRLCITGKLADYEPARKTPAGIEVLTATLNYQGSVTENGIDRQLDFEMTMMAIGNMAQMLKDCQIGDILEISGFIAPKSKRSRQLILHIQTLNIKE